MSACQASGKIKVCHIIAKMVYGGASLGTLHLIRGLDQNVFDCTILCGSQSEQEGDLLPKIEKSISDVIIIPEMIREVNPIKDVMTFIKLVSIIKRNKYGIVHTHGSKAGAIGRLAAAICRTPIILHTIHGWGLKAGDLFARTLYRFVERLLASFTTKLLFQTQSDVEEARTFYIGKEEQYHLIGNGINLQPFLKYNVAKANELKSEFSMYKKKIVGTVGRVSAQKNPQGFIKIAQEVLATKKDVLFIFVGGGELLRDMQQLVDRFRLANNIIFTGVRDDVPEIVANFDVFVLPSLWEGMPRSVLEAMAMSKPVVVHGISGISEIVTDGRSGFIVPIHDTCTFADRVLCLLDNPNRAKTIGRCGSVKAREFDYDLVVERVKNIYIKLCQCN